jgi:serine phosphatase RsbU (regulator of sigma subunit)
MLLLYTDGLYEVDNAAGEQFGQQRLLETVRRHLEHPASVLFEETLRTIHAFAGREDFPDDLCLVSVELVRLTR